MKRVMPMRVIQMRKIFLAWFIPISAGLIVSIATVHANLFPTLVGYLGVFWLLVLSFGYVWNGIVDKPANWYFVAAFLNMAGAVLILTDVNFLKIQYLLAAVINVMALILLLLFRSE